MPDQKEIAHSESGRATAPPSVCYYSSLTSASEDYIRSSTEISVNSLEKHSAATSQSPLYSSNFNNFHQKIQSSASYISDCSPCPSPHSYISSNTTKTEYTNLPFQSPHYSTDYFTPSHIRTSSFSSFNNSSTSGNPVITNSNLNSIINNSVINDNINNNSNSGSNFEFASTSKTSPKNQEDFNIAQEALAFQSPEELSVTAFNYSKISKSNLISNSKPTLNYSDISFNPNYPGKYSQNKETVDLCLEKSQKLKKNLEGTQKLFKTFKDDNIEESQQFHSKNGTKIKNTQEPNQDLVTDSLLHLLHKKNSQENLSYDLGDISPILVSLTSKYKSEEVSGLKKKESNEDFKLMNDFLTKIILEKEEKRFKTFDEKKKNLHKETLDDLNNELDERKIKRDAMSHYQEDKNHKRSSNYGDYNQWEYFGQQDIQPSNNHNRRGHFSFGNTSQQHSGWNQMGIGIPRQSNPYYTNPHSQMMPAHAHSDYRYNQWSNPHHKNIPNVHNAHSQNPILSQGKVDIKHHPEISNSVQDFGLTLGSTSDFSKFRTGSRDLMHRTPPNISEKSTRTTARPDHLTSLPTAIRNTSAVRTPPIPSHPKTVINNPLSDLQMLVTNQESESPPQKVDNFQQESVDLSAHSDISKQKESSDDKTPSVNNRDLKDFRSPVSVIQIQNKQVKNSFNESEKPVELTSKINEKSADIEITPSHLNNLENRHANSDLVIENVKEFIQNEVLKSGEEPVKTSVIVGKDGDSSTAHNKNETGVSKNVQNNVSKIEAKENFREEKKEEQQEKTDVQPKENKVEEQGKPVEVNEKASEKTVNEPEKKVEEDVDSSKNCKRKAEDEQIPCENKKVCLEVESQVEKVNESTGGGPAEFPTVTSTSTDIKPQVNEVLKKTPKKKPTRKSRLGRLSSGQSSESERSLSCKKGKNLGNKEDNKKKMKKRLCDVMDRRGPFLHVMGPKESPASVIIVNFPKGDDEDEKDKSLAKKQTLNANRTKHHNELDYRGRSRNGLYSSTLSARYDAHTTDYTWVCVFCKKGPHYNTMGDLFGPYIISKDESTSLGDFSGDEKDISDAQKRGGRNKKSLRSNNMVEHFQKMSKKLRRTQSTESYLTGMTVISDDQVDQLRYEVWVHEQCAVWSPNVFLIGTRIIGMQEAIWCSVKTMCSRCGIFGANIGCVYRNCPNRSHYYCAKECGWSLEQETFISTCHIHKPRS